GLALRCALTTVNATTSTGSDSMKVASFNEATKYRPTSSIMVVRAAVTPPLANPTRIREIRYSGSVYAEKNTTGMPTVVAKVTGLTSQSPVTNAIRPHVHAWP